MITFLAYLSRQLSLFYSSLSFVNNESLLPLLLYSVSLPTSFFFLVKQFTVALPFHSEGLGLEVSMSENEAHIVVTGFVRKQLQFPNPPSMANVPNSSSNVLQTPSWATNATAVNVAADAAVAAAGAITNTAAYAGALSTSGSAAGIGPFPLLPVPAAATGTLTANSSVMKQAELSGLIQVLGRAYACLYA